MSFRRNRQESLEWHHWVKTNQERLIAIGIPREIWQERGDWQRFLQEGFHSEPTNWRAFRFALEDLDQEHRKQLYQFLLEIGSGPNCYGSTVWDALQREFGELKTLVETKTDAE